MKKITLFALAALTASSAFAAFPQRQTLPVKLDRTQIQKAAVKSPYVAKAKAISRAEANEADDVTPIVSPLPTYRTFDALYLGWSNEWRYYSVPFGFMPAANVDFYCFYKADKYDWSWNILRNEGDIEQTADTKNISIATSPFLQFDGPSLNITTESGVVSYCDSVAEYFCGGNPSMYSNNLEGFGLTPVRYTDDAFRSYFASVSYSDTVCNENGTYKDLAAGLPSRYEKCTDFKLTGWGSVLPGSSAPYLLKGGYMMLYFTTKQATELTVTVMSLTEDGYINRADTIGVGSMMLPEGTVQGDPVSFEVFAVDSVLGVPVDQPIVVPTTGVYISISGINNPEVITNIDPLINSSTCLQYNLSDYNTNPVYDYIIDWNATLEFDCKNADGEDVSALSSCVALYYANDERTKLQGIAEYCIFYDVEYPFIACATEGFEAGDMTIEIPVEGGKDGRYFEANQDIMQLMEDQYVTLEVEGDGDWLTYEIAPDDEYPTIFTLVVEADPLPEGVEGRKATFTFTGYGFDNTITVTQGVVAGINDVAAPVKAKNGIVYDLQGRAVKNATKGIYIVDGKKVIL